MIPWDPHRSSALLDFENCFCVFFFFLREFFVFKLLDKFVWLGELVNHWRPRVVIIIISFSPQANLQLASLNYYYEFLFL